MEMVFLSWEEWATVAAYLHLTAIQKYISSLIRTASVMKWRWAEHCEVHWSWRQKGRRVQHAGRVLTPHTRRMKGRKQHSQPYSPSYTQPNSTYNDATLRSCKDHCHGNLQLEEENTVESVAHGPGEEEAAEQVQVWLEALGLVEQRWSVWLQQPCIWETEAWPVTHLQTKTSYI